MRYYYEREKRSQPEFGELYFCNHLIYDRCTLYKNGELGLSVIQQRFSYSTKRTYWGEIDSWLIDPIYLNDNFNEYFLNYASASNNGIYPTVTVRQIMWALRMKPLKKHNWETVFDRKFI